MYIRLTARHGSSLRVERLMLSATLAKLQIAPIILNTIFRGFNLFGHAGFLTIFYFTVKSIVI